MIISASAVWDRVFFDVEADLGFGRKRRRFEQRTELLVNVAQGAVVEQERFVNFGQSWFRCSWLQKGDDLVVAHAQVDARMTI